MKAACLTILMCSYLMANTPINWASDGFAINEDSNGNPLTSEFIFELGTFSSGFDPNDYSTWATNWTALDRTRYQEDDTFFGKATVLTSNAAPFSAGGKAYIWGYKPSGPVSEWILITDPSWVWPTVSALSLATNFLVANANQTHAGLINGSGYQMQTEVSSEASPSVSWGEWLQFSFTDTQLADPALSGFDADPDGDAQSNAEEYFAGGDPFDSTSQLFQICIVSSADGSKHVEIPHSSSAELDLELQFSTDLNTFQPVAGEMQLSSPSLFSDLWITVGSPTYSKCFYRIVFTEP